jgi:hypothetical protein
MRNTVRQVEERVDGLLRAMESKSRARRERAYRDLLPKLDDVRRIAPRHADGAWEGMVESTKLVAGLISASYHATAIKIKDAPRSVQAYPIGPRSRFAARYRSTVDRFSRLPRLYWVRVETPWFVQNSMPYMRLRGRILFWPGLETLGETCDSIDELRSLEKHLRSMFSTPPGRRLHECGGELESESERDGALAAAG